MEVKTGINPFLFTDEDYAAPPVSNPFLMDTDEGFDNNGAGDNPFLQNTSTFPSNGGTNPFAFNPEDLETSQEANIPILQKPTELDLNLVGDPQSKQLPPRVPPSKETQDLLMSVMGAMDATSSHLLDKIPPTRTPSPVSMRDLHSPSPTPAEADLLDVDGNTSDNNKNTGQDLLGDINRNSPQHSIHQPQQQPPNPTPPNRPKPPRPKPPTRQPSLTKVEIPIQEPSDIDMFGVSEAPKVATKADIMNLYNTPKEKPTTDLLCDSNILTIDEEVPSVVSIPPTVSIPQTVSAVLPIMTEAPPAVPAAIMSPSATTPIPIASPIVQDNFAIVQDNEISPEKSMNELHMDTSDSQSKGSASSVQFNPFAATDDLITSPKIEENVLMSSEPMKPFSDEFDMFAQKFESVKVEDTLDAFPTSTSAWGDFGAINDSSTGFGNDDTFDAFLALQEPPGVPQSTPNRVSKAPSQESDEEKDFNVIIRPKTENEFSGVLPTIAPPPVATQAAFTDTSPRFNPFDLQNDLSATQVQEKILQRTDSQETPPTPLYDEDVSQPLEPFPRTDYSEEGWEMHLRQPNKKKITGQRFWKKIFVKLVYQQDCVLLQLYNQQGDKDPFQELPLQPCYSVSEIGAQQYDQFGKIFTIKLQYIFYKERPGVRPGQVKKAERITNKLSQFAAYAIQGDYQGVKEFGSDLKKLGLPVEHAPQVSQLMKLGSLNYEDLKQFSFCIEEALFKLQAHRDRALHYKMEEVQITLVDELYVEQDADGHVEKQIARVRLFFLGFLTGMPDVELGLNDMRRQGKEVVGRHDIIPVVTEEWIRFEGVEFHSCIQQDEYQNTHTIRFKPPDACYIELMRFRVRPPKNRELPLQLKASICITGNRVELRADVLVPGFASRKLGQIPCEDVMIRFPIPECWIYLFRVEKHFRYGSVKSAHRRTGKIKGIERILGTVDTLQESLIEVTSGQAKYEHQHRAIVWRCPRLPKEGQGAYTTHNMVCKMALTSYDQMPDKLAEYCYVEFTMPATQVSHTTCRSVSLQNSDSDDPPEKYVRYLARHEYRVGIEHTKGESPNAYAAATFVKSTPIPIKEEEKPAPVPEEASSSDSD